MLPPKPHLVLAAKRKPSCGVHQHRLSYRSISHAELLIPALLYGSTTLLSPFYTRETEAKRGQRTCEQSPRKLASCCPKADPSFHSQKAPGLCRDHSWSSWAVGVQRQQELPPEAGFLFVQLRISPEMHKMVPPPTSLPVTEASLSI